MRAKTRSHKPGLELGLESNTHKKILFKISEVVEEVEIRLESYMNAEPNVSPVREEVEVETKIEGEATPSKLSGKKSTETDPIGEEILVKVDNGRKGELSEHANTKRSRLMDFGA